MSEPDLSNYPRPPVAAPRGLPIIQPAIINLKKSFNPEGLILGASYCGTIYITNVWMSRPLVAYIRATLPHLAQWPALVVQGVILLMVGLTFMTARSIAISEAHAVGIRRLLSLGSNPWITLCVAVRTYAVSYLIAGLITVSLGWPLPILRSHHFISQHAVFLINDFLLLFAFSFVYAKYNLAPFIVVHEGASATDAIRLSKLRTQKRQLKIGAFYSTSYYALDRGYAFHYVPAFFLFEFHARNLAYLYSAIKPSPEDDQVAIPVLQ